MTWLIVLSGSKGFIIPNIILGAFIYCKLRQQFSETWINENKKHLLSFCTEGT